MAVLVAQDEGPFGIFVWLRTQAGSYDYDEEGNVTSNLGRGLLCPLCAGVWCACLCACLLTWRSVAGDFFLTWMGIAGAQATLFALVGWFNR